MRKAARLNVEVSPDLRDRIKVEAAQRRLSIRLIVIEALEDWLDAQTPFQPPNLAEMTNAER